MLDKDLHDRIKENNIDSLQQIFDEATTIEWVSHPDVSHRRLKTTFLDFSGKTRIFHTNSQLANITKPQNKPLEKCPME